MLIFVLVFNLCLCGAFISVDSVDKTVHRNDKKCTEMIKILISVGGMRFAACIPIMLIKFKHYSNGRFAASVLKYITKVYGIEWRLRNGKILEEDRGAIVVSNHQLCFDMLGVMNIWEVPKKVVMVSKKELIYAGTLGLAGYLSDTVFIDRTKPKEAIKKLEATSELMNKHKVKIWMYPEGTRNVKKTEKILPFKKGAFTMAVNAQVPIIPVVYSPYTFIDANRYIFDKGYVVMQCLEPISTSGLTMDDVPMLMKNVHNIMVQAYEKLSATETDYKN